MPGCLFGLRFSRRDCRTLCFILIGMWIRPISGEEIPARPGDPHLPTILSPFDVGNRAQLFVDRLLVRETENLSFTQHQGKPHPANPLIVADRPWEGWRLEIFGTVLYDREEGIYKMWYTGESPEDFPDYPILYATSLEGIRWEKPLLGRLKSATGAETNAVAEGYLLASVMKDLRDPDPSRRYKMICWRQKLPYSAQTMTSPDGIAWKQLREQGICRSSDVITGYYDELRESYVAFPKLNTLVRGHERRCFGVTFSKDFLNWSEPIPVFLPDHRDDAGSLGRLERVREILDRPDDPNLMRTEFYGIGLYPHESCTLSFPWVFTINNNGRYGNQEGPCEIQLAVSRNLIDWERPHRTPIIPHGKPGTWDVSYQQTSARAIRVGDEIRLYYCGANYTHGTPALYSKRFDDGSDTGRKSRYTSSIGMVSWELDRFVSVDGPSTGGTLTTVPIRFSGERLEVNAEVPADGSLVVEILDTAGNPIPGVVPSDPVRGNHLRTDVLFSGNRTIGIPGDRPITLRFRLTNAKLYSFAFR